MNWTKELNVSITVCDKEGTIVEMNDKSQKTFAKSGGGDLVGQSVIECHPEPAKSMLKNMLAEPITNAYTIEKDGVKKLIYQTPWYENGTYQGFVELSLEIPFEMKHSIRKPSVG
jgi:transcriptional regulator with PAS, ATPase and Fis domain